MIATYEHALSLADELAKTYEWRETDPDVILPLVKVIGERHVPAYHDAGPHAAWQVGTVSMKIDKYREAPEPYEVPVFVTSANGLAFLWPTQICIASHYVGYSDQHVTLLIFRELNEEKFSPEELQALHKLLACKLSQMSYT